MHSIAFASKSSSARSAASTSKRSRGVRRAGVRFTLRESKLRNTTFQNFVSIVVTINIAVNASTFGAGKATTIATASLVVIAPVTIVRVAVAVGFAAVSAGSACAVNVVGAILDVRSIVARPIIVVW